MCFVGLVSEVQASRHDEAKLASTKSGLGDLPTTYTTSPLHQEFLTFYDIGLGIIQRNSQFLYGFKFHDTELGLAGVMNCFTWGGGISTSFLGIKLLVLGGALSSLGIPLGFMAVGLLGTYLSIKYIYDGNPEDFRNSSQNVWRTSTLYAIGSTAYQLKTKLASSLLTTDPE